MDDWPDQGAPWRECDVKGAHSSVQEGKRDAAGSLGDTFISVPGIKFSASHRLGWVY